MHCLLGIEQVVRKPLTPLWDPWGYTEPPPVLFTGLQGISVALPCMLWAVGGIFHHLVGSQGPSRTMRGPQATPGFALCTPRFSGHVWGEGLHQRKQCWEMGFLQSEGLPADSP